VRFSTVTTKAVTISLRFIPIPPTCRSLETRHSAQDVSVTGRRAMRWFRKATTDSPRLLSLSPLRCGGDATDVTAGPTCYRQSSACADLSPHQGRRGSRIGEPQWADITGGARGIGFKVNVFIWIWKPKGSIKASSLPNLTTCFPSIDINVILPFPSPFPFRNTFSPSPIAKLGCFLFMPHH
jgi:hypothetical protein